MSLNPQDAVLPVQDGHRGHVTHSRTTGGGCRAVHIIIPAALNTIISIAFSTNPGTRKKKIKKKHARR